MSENTSIQQRVTERFEHFSDEAKAAADKLTSATRGALGRIEDSGNELFENLVKAGEKRTKAQAKPAKKTAAKKKAEPNKLEELRDKIAVTVGLPTQAEVDALNKKLTSLTRKVNKLAKEVKGS